MKSTNPPLELSTHCSKDRISDLPNDVMQHILSFGTVKDAVKTCTLCRNWESLWTSIPNLRFHFEYRYDFNKYTNKIRARPFVYFVDRALMLYSARKVKTFLLDFQLSYEFKDRVDSWLLFAVTHEVEELFLTLALHVIRYDWSWTWPSLKVLCLVGLKLAPKDIRSIFGGSPLLECLTLRSCKLTKCERGCYMIDSIGLKYLTVDICEFDYESYREGNEMFCEGFLEIKTPNLLSLNVLGYNQFSFLKLGNLPSLIEANVSFEIRPHISATTKKKLVSSILQKLRHVNRLVVGDFICKVLTDMKLNGEIFRPTLTCKSLKIKMALSNIYLHKMEVLLHSFPFLKQLILDVRYGSRIKPRKKHMDENYWRLKMGSLECLNQTLEKVEIIGFDITCHKENVLEVAQFLLGNAKVLKKLTMHGRIYIIKQFGLQDPRQAEMSKIEIEEKLLHYPRASVNAVVVFDIMIEHFGEFFDQRL